MTRFIGLDPSTKTGIVILDRDGRLLDSFEIVASSKEDPARMIDIVQRVADNIEFGDIVAIEGFAFGARGQGMAFQFGLGYLMRADLFNNAFQYHEVAPSALKKFAGSKGNAKKDELAVDIFKRWGFEHKSDNVRDAYVLAQIARALYKPVELTKFQQEVIAVLRNPPEKKRKARAAR